MGVYYIFGKPNERELLVCHSLDRFHKQSKGRCNKYLDGKTPCTDLAKGKEMKNASVVITEQIKHQSQIRPDCANTFKRKRCPERV